MKNLIESTELFPAVNCVLAPLQPAAGLNGPLAGRGLRMFINTWMMID